MEHDNWKDKFGQAIKDAHVFIGAEQDWFDGFDSRNLDAVRDELLRTMPPIDMVLHCPKCHVQHIDKPGMHSELDDHTWTNPPHRSHLCHSCGHIWRPADVATNGVQSITTRGKNDSPTT